MRTILGQDDESEFKIDIPDDATLTYGPNAPYATKETNYSAGKQGWSLRIYVGQKKLIACMTNVKWFRETTVKISRLVENVATEQVWKNNDGGYETKTIISRSRQLKAHSDEGDGFVDVKPATSKGKK